jgi:hypothetical protein
MEKIKKDYKYILKKLSRTRDLMYSTDFFWGLLLGLTSTSWAIIVLSAIEYFGNFPSEVRLFFYAMFWLSFIIPFGTYSLSPFLKIIGFRHTIKLDALALKIGNHYNDIKDKLSNSIQLMQTIENSRGISSQLATASFSEIFDVSKTRNFNVVIDKKKIYNILIIFFVSLVMLIGSFSIFNQSLTKGLYRIQNWQQNFIPPAPFKLYIYPKFSKVLINSDVKIQIKAIGIAPEKIKLNIKEGSNADYDGFTLTLDTGNTYNFTFTNLKNSLQFFAEAGWLNSSVLSDIGKIEVYERPYIRSMSGNINFPAYTKLPPRQISEQNGDIAALKGSSVNLQIIASHKLSAAKIVFVTSKQIDSTNEQNIKNDTTFQAMTIVGERATGSFKINRSCAYYISITDSLKENNEQPVQYGIIALTDEYPTIKLIQPTYNVKLTEDATLPISVNITDDYGFSRLSLYYRLSSSKFAQPEKDFHKIDLPIIYNGLNVEIPYVWNLKNLDIVPDDKFEFYLEVADNDNVSGPKTSRTDILTAELPSIDEVLKENNQSQDNIQKQMENMLKETKDLQKDMEQFNRELSQNNNKAQLTFEEQKKSNELLKRQEDVKDKIQNLQQELSKTVDKLNQNNLLSPETMQKYMELQKLMKEIDSPELRRLQQLMEQATQKLSREDLQNALKNLKFNEEQFKKSIERTMKILQRLQAEQKIDALNKKAEKMQDEQSAIQKELQNTSPKNKDKIDQLQKRESQLKSETKSMEKELQDLEKLMSKIGQDEMPMSELKDAQKSLNSNETQNEMQQSADEMQQGNMNNASQSMQKAKQNLSNFKQKMQKLKQEMDKRNSQEAIRQMQRAVNDILQLSQNQEDINNKTKDINPSSTLLPQLGQQQMDQFESLMKVAERLSDLSEKSFGVTPQMGNEIASGLQNMSNALDNFTDRRMNSIIDNQSKALGNLNSAAAQMQDMLNNMKQSNGTCPNPGGSGQPNSMGNGNALGQKLQQLAAQQQAISQMMQQMMSGNQQQGQGGMSQEQQAQYQRIMQNQQQAQKTFQQLQDEAKQYGNTPEGKKLKNDLDNLKKEMDETVSDVRQNGVRADNMKKQDQILSKLLDLYNSQNEKEFEKRRESREGKQFNLQSPADINFSKQEGSRAILDQLLKQSGKQYTIDYQNLIQQYFNNLNNDTNKTK